MKVRHNGAQKFIFVFTLGILICWAAAGNASEQWDAKASARVNLRTNPSRNGVILSIVPQGQKVRIMEKQGLWCKVNVEGKIYGKGWVYAEYLEEILPKSSTTESASQIVRVEITSGEQKQGYHPVEPPPKMQTEGEEVKQLRAALSAKTSIAGVKEPSSARNKKPATKIDTGAQLKVEISKAGESAHIAAIQALPEAQTEVDETKPLSTSLSGTVSKTGAPQQVSAQNELQDAKNESNALSKLKLSMTGEPVKMPPAQPASTDLKQDAFGISQKSSSGANEQGKTSLHLKSLPGGEKRQDGGVRETPSLVREKNVTEAPTMAVSINRSAVSHETKRLINVRESMGPVEITLKLLVIALSCLVILFLHRANKIATNHYDALMQFQHSLDARPSR